MQKHKYGIVTHSPMKSLAHSATPVTLGEAMKVALGDSNYDEAGDGFEINHYETVAEIRIDGRLMDGGQAVRTNTTRDIGREGVEAGVNSLLAQFEKIRKIEVKIVSRDVDLNP